MRWQLMGGVILGVFFSQTAPAAERTFPYEAIVDSEEVFVRSGPGKEKYYPTGKLHRGDRVTVIRHDPGGWFVIVPPADSFSWIPTEFVKRTEGNRGLVTTSNFVRIGSTFGDNTHDIRHRISAGETVEILEEKTLQTGRGPVPMFKIKPIQGEYRYVPGAAVIPADALPENTPAGDPFAPPVDVARASGDVPPPRDADFPPAAGRFGPPEPLPVVKNAAPSAKETESVSGGLVERPLVRTTEEPVVQSFAPSTEQTFEELDRLRQVDAQFREMIRRDIKDWHLSGLEQKYLSLREHARSPLLPAEIDRRLAELDRWEKIEQEYQDFLQLTSETNRRDAQLLSIAQQRIQQAPVPPGGSASEIEPVPQPQAVSSGVPSPVPPQSPAAMQPGAAPRQEQARLSAPFQTQVRRSPRFDGAGIVQRSATTYPGAPRHVLVAPNGRVLAYLHAGPGLNLDRFVGRAMGIYGQRSFRRELQADLIIVRGLAPVRLIP